MRCLFAKDRSISAWHGIQGQPMDFAAHPIHPAGQLVVTHDPPQQRASWAKHGTRGFYLPPALSHYRSHVVFIPSLLDARITNQLDFFPDPLFTFEDPTISIPPPDPTSSRPLDGSDLISQVFVDPDLGLCRVTGHGQHAFLQPNTGNLAPGQRLSSGWHPTPSYTTPTGTVEHSTVTEVARWVQEHPPLPSLPAIVLPSHPHTFPPERLVVPPPKSARSLRSHLRPSQAPPMPDCAPLPRLQLPDTALPAPRRSPRFTAERGASLFVASAGGCLHSPRFVSWSDPLATLAVPPTTFIPRQRLPPVLSLARLLSSAGALSVAASHAVYPRSPLPSPAPQTPTWFETTEPEV
jgi:hypothetical protein